MGARPVPGVTKAAPGRHAGSGTAEEDAMTVLKNYPEAQQETPYSCWACAARSIINFAKGKIVYDSDQALATAYAEAAKKPAYADINVMRSAADALWSLGFESGTDGSPIPTKQELEQEFKNGKPFLSIVGDVNPKGQPNKKYQEGHWVVLIGLSNDDLSVFDPADGRTNVVPYNAATYTKGVYWENTSYLDFPKG
jgi:hypothetical protein